MTTSIPMLEPETGVAKAALRKPLNMRVLSIYASAIITGIMIGCVMVVLRLGAPDQPTLSGPIEPGEEKIITIPWPVNLVTNREQTIFMDLAITERVAEEVAVTIEMIDPENPGTRLPLVRVDAPQGEVKDKLIFTAFDFNLDPLLVSSRGVVRQIKATTVDLAVRVERLSGTKMGYVYVMNAGAFRPLRPDESAKALGELPKPR